MVKWYDFGLNDWSRDTPDPNFKPLTNENLRKAIDNLKRLEMERQMKAAHDPLTSFQTMRPPKPFLILSWSDIINAAKGDNEPAPNGDDFETTMLRLCSIK
jgi:hypothetical protein